MINCSKEKAGTTKPRCAPKNIDKPLLHVTSPLSQVTIIVPFPTINCVTERRTGDLGWTPVALRIYMIHGNQLAYIQNSSRIMCCTRFSHSGRGRGRTAHRFNGLFRYLLLDTCMYVKSGPGSGSPNPSERGQIPDLDFSRLAVGNGGQSCRFVSV